MCCKSVLKIDSHPPNSRTASHLNTYLFPFSILFPSHVKDKTQRMSAGIMEETLSTQKRPESPPKQPLPPLLPAGGHGPLEPPQQTTLPSAGCCSGTLTPHTLMPDQPEAPNQGQEETRPRVTNKGSPSPSSNSPPGDAHWKTSHSPLKNNNWYSIHNHGLYAVPKLGTQGTGLKTQMTDKYVKPSPSSTMKDKDIPLHYP